MRKRRARFGLAVASSDRLERSIAQKIKASSEGNGKDARIVIRLSLWS
jgi:hypothetical protein